MKRLIFLIAIVLFSAQICVYANNNMTVKTKLFSVTMPEELNGVYEAKTEKDKISFYHKESKEAGFGGFAFGIKAYKNPADHAFLPGSRKIGELQDKKGNLYDVVLKHPTDVQYDYTKSTNPPESFKKLYDHGEKVDIEGINGAKYFKNQGMKGEDLYKDILKKHLTAINENWDSARLEKENMSYMYNILPKEKIGYAYYDANADGVDELLIGEIAEGAWKGVIYDIYTMVNRTPQHSISGGSRNRYYVCDGSFICNEYSSGALESGVRVYILVENSTELFPQVSFKYDGYKNSKKPWFISYSDENWMNVDEKTYNERKKVFEQYKRFDFIPLDKITVDKPVEDKFDSTKDYFDYSVLLKEFPKNYYYTTVKINKSKERILIITDKINDDKTTNSGLFYYIDKSGFVYSFGLIESTAPISQSKDYIYINNEDKTVQFYISDKNLKGIRKIVPKADKKALNIEFETIESADKFSGDFGSPAGDDVEKVTLEGFYFEYHKSQYKKAYIEELMKECIKDGVKTQVQMYCQMVKKLHP